MTDFRVFAAAVKERFNELSKQELFVVNINGDDLYEFYLDAFPVGTNEIYRTRREFDCSADKNFIRNIGNVVAIVNDGNKSFSLATVWDVAADEPFNTVAQKLAELVRNASVKTLFRTKETNYGAELIRELLDNGTTHPWYNLNAKVDPKHRTDKPEEIRGTKNTFAQVFKRGLEELTASAVETVTDLIASDSIYRGAEHKVAVTEFSKLQKEYLLLNSDEARNLFIWANIDSRAAGFRNTAIGTLVEDLSKGVDLDRAVGSFEAKVAPSNYKRSKSLITPAMIKDAMKTITGLGLETALERRFAVISDVSVNNVLFVDNSVKGKMKGGIESLLMEQAVTKAPDVKKAENITIDDFLANVVPKASSIDVMVKNTMAANFMSLTAPVHDEVERLFKWDNNFAWSYDGNITDSEIKEKVARAGGNVTNAALRISLAWYNTDDLDLHVFTPRRNHIYFGNPEGALDVDMNAYGRIVRNPVENVSFTPRNLEDGVYKVVVNNYNRRESVDVGFVIEVENSGVVNSYSYRFPVDHKEDIKVVDITIKNGIVSDIKVYPKIDGTALSKEKWGVKTETLVPVETLILSPNYWDDNASGNKHWFFILKDCVNPEPTRGIYNEFLRGDLDKHRKVFEILGDKTKCQPSDNQLSGIGFSSTKREQLIAVVKGEKLNKVYNINF
jgi:hypothetical protein